MMSVNFSNIKIDVSDIIGALMIDKYISAMLLWCFLVYLINLFKSASFQNTRTILCDCFFPAVKKKNSFVFHKVSIVLALKKKILYPNIVAIIELEYIS